MFKSKGAKYGERELCYKNNVIKCNDSVKLLTFKTFLFTATYEVSQVKLQSVVKGQRV